MLTAGAPVEVVVEPLASAAILEFAKENGVDIEKVVGTGKDGRIKKSDVEALIDAQDLA
ncbi:dihydrolipoamide acetyltransferase [compost metagenome]